MAKKTLASLSLDALLQLRDDVSAAVRERAERIKKELASLGEDFTQVGRIAVYGRKSLKGRKVPAKYRDPKSGETWSGRGVQPTWLRDAVKRGKAIETFLIDKPRPAKKKKKRTAKAATRRTKAAKRRSKRTPKAAAKAKTTRPSVAGRKRAPRPRELAAERPDQGQAPANEASSAT